jgi:N-acetylmuramate 1-kinase
LLKRDGKPRYLQFMPRVWKLLEGDLAHPAMAPVRAWFDKHIPPAQRIAPKATQ